MRLLPRKIGYLTYSHSISHTCRFAHLRNSELRGSLNTSDGTLIPTMSHQWVVILGSHLWGMKKIANIADTYSGVVCLVSKGKTMKRESGAKPEQTHCRKLHYEAPRTLY